MISLEEYRKFPNYWGVYGDLCRGVPEVMYLAMTQTVDWAVNEAVDEAVGEAVDNAVAVVVSVAVFDAFDRGLER